MFFFIMHNIEIPFVWTRFCALLLQTILEMFIDHQKRKPEKTKKPTKLKLQHSATLEKYSYPLLSTHTQRDLFIKMNWLVQNEKQALKHHRDMPLTAFILNYIHFQATHESNDLWILLWDTRDNFKQTVFGCVDYFLKEAKTQFFIGLKKFWCLEIWISTYWAE